VSVLSTLEKRFSLQTADLGLIVSGFEIGNLMLVLLMSYLGGKGHRPRLIACGGIVMAFGSLLCALPEFLSHQYDYQKEKLSTLSEACSPNSSIERKWMEMEDCVETKNTDMMYVLLVAAQIIIGIGASSVQPLGISYMDDHVQKKESSLYIGIILTTLLFGPLFGFLMGAVFTKIYVDAIFIDTAKLDITTDDPRWIGAWWAGFLVCAGLLFFSSLLMFGFPRSMSASNKAENHILTPMLPNKDSKELNRAAFNKTQEGVNYLSQMGTCCHHLRGLYKVTKQLLQNPVFTCVVLAACMGLAAVGGVSAFLGKYLEWQFGLSASYANQLIGLAAMPCVCIGTFLGGYLVKKFNLTPAGTIQLGMTTNVLCSAAFISLLFMGCETSPTAGVTVDYMNGPAWQNAIEPTIYVYTWCNTGCECRNEALNPVCGSDGITYLSPCYAGCIDTNFTVCTCISTDIENDAVAIPGRCPSSGCMNTFPVFFAIFCVGCFLGAMGHTPTVVILIRAVNPQVKSYALGVQFLMLRLLAFIPMPLIFGAAIDSACLVWSDTCGKPRSCAVYNNITYRYLYFSISIGLKTVTFILLTITWYFIKDNTNKYLQGHEESARKITNTELFASTPTLSASDRAKSHPRTTFIYHLGDNEMCENIESVL
uniref:Solute carrier organic anion transporter family member n=1 Tax=Latimeria chalumnae TaxID=7897 RepID=H3ANZ9_LATCH